jgi:hypothetical protein
VAGETREKISGWTTDTLHAHLVQIISDFRNHVDTKFEEADRRYSERFIAQQQALSDAMAAQEKSVAVAESNSQAWRESANEWRGTLSDRDKKFMLEETGREIFKSLDTRLAVLEKSSNKQEGSWSTIGAVIGVALAVAALVVAFFKH